MPLSSEGLRILSSTLSFPESLFTGAARTQLPATQTFVWQTLRVPPGCYRTPDYLG